MQTVHTATAQSHNVSDATLVKSLPGFRNGYAEVDGVRLPRDLYELIKSLGYDKASVAGHDIGSAVAFANGQNHPQATDKLVMMELPHPILH